jgi:hypothetical protein
MAMAALRINAPLVVAELFETEVVVIHLERGTYYSLTGAACQLWPLLAAGLDAEALVQSLGALGPDWAGAAGELHGFIALLLAEELVRADAGESLAPVAPPPPAAYQPPRLEKFTDMEELIALDPVHDVAASEGWPLRTPIGPESP